jgi:hypothetical protein
MRSRSRVPVALLLGFGLQLGCSEDAPPAERTPTPASDPASRDQVPAEAGEPDPAPPGLDADPLVDDWADTPPPDLGTEPPPPPAAEPYPGPCKVRWIEGPILRFSYDKDETTLRIDLDGDGKADLCSRSKRADGRLTHISVDEGCNRKVDFKLAPRYEDGANLATASYTAQSGGSKVKRALTLVTLPVYAGMPGGYPLHAPREAIEIELSDGRVVAATVTKPEEGPPLKVTFDYDQEGRLERLEEDYDLDGAIDRRFAFKYDDVGNVEQMRYVMGRGEGAKKGFARLDYRCWNDAPKP